MFRFLRGGSRRRVSSGLGKLCACALSTVVQWCRSGPDSLLSLSLYRDGTRPPHSRHLQPLNDSLGGSHRIYLWVGVHYDGYGLGVGPGKLGAVENEVELALCMIVEVGMHRCIAPPT